jgi:hypothetical protein
MTYPEPPEGELLKTLLEPLLEDFQYWFERSRQLLETQIIESLDSEQQAHLLERVKAAQQEVGAAQSLMKATDNRIGIEASILKPWHQLVAECWKVSIQHRLDSSKAANSDRPSGQ